jgi:hypothetical protein
METPVQTVGQQAMTRWEDLKIHRGTIDAEREEIARFFDPYAAGIQTQQVPGQWTGRGLLSSFPVVARTNAAAGLFGTLNNPANTWFALSVADRDLASWQPAAAWLDFATARVVQSFTPAVSSFYSATMTTYGDVVTFGNAIQYDEIMLDKRRIKDLAIPLGQVVFDIDDEGNLLETIRRFPVKPRAAVKLFGFDTLPEQVQKLAERGDTQDLWFLHWVQPNDQFIDGRLGLAGKAYVSVYVSETGVAQVGEAGGNYEMPYYHPGWQGQAGEIYSRGMAHIALPSARKLELHERNFQRAAALAGNPPMGVADTRSLRAGGAIAPGRVIVGARSPSGQQLVGEILSYRGTPISKDAIDAAIDECRDAMHWSLMTLAGRTGMTATEIVERSEERLRMMAPFLGRLQDQFLLPKIERRFKMLMRTGQLPPPPPELRGQTVGVEYTSAAALAQRSAEGAATRRWAEDLALVAQIAPEVADTLDPDAFAAIQRQARGAPASVMRSAEEVAQIRQARAEAQQQAQMAEMAKMGAGAMRDMASAGEAANAGAA